MYRTSAEEKQENAPGTLVLEAKNRERSYRGGIALLQIFSLPVIFACIVSAFLDGTAALVALVGSAAGMWWWWKRGNSERVTLDVDKGFVELHRVPRMQRFGLVDVLDVSLETKTIQPVQDGGSAIPLMRVIDSKVGPDVDTARVVATIRGKRLPVQLHDKFLSYGDATEWLGKVRVFLRKHGWEPLSERPAPNVRESDEDEDEDEAQD